MTLEQMVAAFTGSFEAAGGPILKAYQDIAGVWTIGFGTTYYEQNGVQVRVAEGLAWTVEQCMDALVAGVSGSVADVVAANTLHPWTTDMIVALADLRYNIGSAAYHSSSVLKFHNQGNAQAASQAFLLWDKAHVDGQLVTVEGLLTRRRAEAARYLSQGAST